MREHPLRNGRRLTRRGRFDIKDLDEQCEEPEEGKKRKVVYRCIVNTKPIKSFVLDREGFHRGVKETLAL